MGQKHTPDQELDEALKELTHEYPTLTRDNAFVLWFALAHLTTSKDEAWKGVTGGARDKGIDALLIHDNTRSISVVQGKYHRPFGGKGIVRADVLSLTEVAQVLADDDDEQFNAYASRCNDKVQVQLRLARQRVLKNEYRVRLYFVTTGTITKTIRDDARNSASYANADYEVFDAVEMKSLLCEPEWGQIPFLDLEMEVSGDVRVESILQRHDSRDGIESWVFPMRGDKIAAIYNEKGLRLFSLNIRGFIGDTDVNKEIRKTLTTEPERFFYFNNGITVLCDDAELLSRQGVKVLRVRRPQFINGQQTTRTLASVDIKNAEKASVLIKVITVRQKASEDGRLDGVLLPIVKGTNRQNKIGAADLMANDLRQRELGKSLERLKSYFYNRKRQTPQEVARQLAGPRIISIKKEDFAQAVAACEIGPARARTAVDKLFEGTDYGRCFPKDKVDPFWYLTRWWVMQMVKRAVRSDKRQGIKEPKWLVLNFVWSQLKDSLTGAKGRVFCDLCLRRDPDLEKPLIDGIREVYGLARKFYDANSGEGDDHIDLDTFYKNQKHADPKSFAEFIAGCTRESQRFDKRLEKVVSAIEMAKEA